MQHNGVFLGATTVDIINYVGRFPNSNSKTIADRQLILAGGPATNAAVAFAALGNQATLASCLGSHPIAALAAQDLAGCAVHHLELTASPDLPPAVSTILVEDCSADRCVVYSDPTAINAVSPTLQPDFDILLFDGFHLSVAVEVARSINQFRERPLMVLDGGSWKHGLEELLPFIDVAICSTAFHIPGCSTAPEATLTELNRCGIARAAITRGADPVLAWQDEGIFEVQVPEVNAVDTLGAGDIFHGAFCHCILQGSYAQALEEAASIAAFACTTHGTRAWISGLSSMNTTSIATP